MLHYTKSIFKLISAINKQESKKKNVRLCLQISFNSLYRYLKRLLSLRLIQQPFLLFALLFLKISQLRRDTAREVNKIALVEKYLIFQYLFLSPKHSIQYSIRPGPDIAHISALKRVPISIMPVPSAPWIRSRPFRYRDSCDLVLSDYLYTFIQIQYCCLLCLFTCSRREQILKITGLVVLFLFLLINLMLNMYYTC